MTLKSTCFALAAVAGSLAASHAGAVTITFEDLAVGSVLSNQYASLGVTFSANPFSGANTNSTTQGWATNTNMTIVAASGTDASTPGTPVLVSGNVLHSLSGWLAEDGDPSFLATFSTPVSTFSIDFMGVTGSNAAFTDVKIFAYNGATLLATISGPLPAPSAVSQFTLGYAAASITRVAVAPGSFADWVGVDNIVFTPVVPEPGSYALMALGLGALALVRRRAAAR